MTGTHFDLIVIGAGPGGYEGALHAAELGMKVALIENRDVGGTCLNRGCIPTKTILHTSSVLAEARKDAALRSAFENFNLNLTAVLEHKQEVSAQLRDGVESLLTSAGVSLIRGKGIVCSSDSVKVITCDGVKMILSASQIIVATGMVPFVPPIPGLTLPGVMTSDDILENCNKPYKSLVVLGGGVIGLELATYFHDIGTEVTIIEGLGHLLPNMDKDLGQNLEMIYKKQGINVYTRSFVTSIEEDDDGLVVHFQKGEEHKTAYGKGVLCALGRRPAVDGLFERGIEPELDGKLLKVNERFETSIPNVYAIGDVSSRIQLAHVAAAQGRACIDYMAGKTPIADLSVVPCCVYTVPEIATVGMDQNEAKRCGYIPVVGKANLFSNGRSVIINAPRSFVKVVADKDTHRILGAQLMFERSGDVITEFSEAIINGLTVEQMLRIIRPHPSFEECVTNALNDLSRKLC